MEEIIKGWTQELEERSAAFQRQALALHEWDLRILGNRNALVALEAEVARAVEGQRALERQLELIDTHQAEVDKALGSIEKDAEDLFSRQQPSLLQDDAAAMRDLMYEQAEAVEAELERVGAKLKDTIGHLNASQGGDLSAADGAGPLDVALKILNNQLSALVHIDAKAEELAKRIQLLSRHGAQISGTGRGA